MTITAPIQFPVKVNGRRMTASVEEEIDHPLHNCFRVRFSDGFEDIFYLDEDFLVGTNEKSVAYAKAIRLDIGNVIGLDTSRFYHIFQEIIDGIITNIWVIENDAEDNEVCYAVYYNEFYRFELKRAGDKWEAAYKSGDKINEDLVKKVGYLLDSLV
jgi:hypothetical protein